MALFRRKADPDAPRLGIYIHIPFCVRKCDYCDFYSVPGRDGRMDEYLHALEVHIAESAPQAEKKEPLEPDDSPFVETAKQSIRLDDLQFGRNYHREE